MDLRLQVEVLPVAVAGALLGAALSIAADNERRRTPWRIALCAGVGVLAALLMSVYRLEPGQHSGPLGSYHPDPRRPVGPILALPALMLALPPLVEVVAAALGRGHPPPLRGFWPWAGRAAFVVTAALFALERKDDLTAARVAALAALAGAFAAARAGGPAGLLPSLGGSAVGYAVGLGLRDGTTPNEEPAFALGCAVAPALITTLALRAADLREDGLAAVGVRLRAPGDLIVLPGLVTFWALLILRKSGARDVVRTLIRDLHAHLWAPSLLAAALGAALLYLGGRVAEARRRRRLESLGAGAPPPAA